MPSSYYTHATGKPANQTRGLASEVRYELDSIAASFDLLPSPTALASGSINYALDTGLTNAYVVSVSSAVTAYSDGFSFFFKPLHNNSGASTLNVNTLGLKAIVRPDGTAVQLNDIVANQILKLTYNSSYNGFQLDTDISYANQAAASASAAAAATSSKYDKTGGTISGHVAVAGTLSMFDQINNTGTGVLEVVNRNGTGIDFYVNAASLRAGGFDASGNLLVNNEISATTNITSGSAATSYTGNDQRNFYAQSYSSNTSQYRYMMNHAGSGLWGIGTSASDQLIIGKASGLNGAPSNILVLVGSDGSMLPGTNGGPKIGSTSLRWGELWVTTGAFNTSNAVLKTPIRTMQEKELAAGYQMAQELGTFQWLDSVKEKGDKARRHVGLTVQRAAEIMESHGLKPWSYGFMGYDKWAAVTEIVDATEDDDGAYQEQVTRQKTEKQASQKQTVEIVNGKPTLKVEAIETDTPVTEQIQVVDADGKPVFIDVQEVPAVLDEEGNEVTPAVPAHQAPMLHAVPVMESVNVWKRVKEVRPAGESYAFRSDQLAFFIAAGVAAKVGA